MEFGELTSRAFEAVDGTADVELRVNATHDDVRLVRLLASGVASQAGFAIDEIEAARLVVDEACVILLDTCEPDDLSAAAVDVLMVRCERVHGSLRVRVTRPMAQATSDPTSVSTRVLDGLASQWSVRLDDVPTVMVSMRSTQQPLDGLR